MSASKAVAKNHKVVQASVKPGGGLLVVLAGGAVWESLGAPPQQMWRRVNLDALYAAIATEP